LIPVASISTGDMYVTASCSLVMHVSNLIVHMHFANGSSSALNYTYSGTKLLKLLLKNYPLKRTLIHGACVKARLPGSAEMKPKEMGNYDNCMLIALPFSKDVCYF